MSHDPTDPKWFRQILGQYPTGVCVVTGQRTGEAPTGMAVGSFTSVSLDPPLVAFLPDRGSTSWPKIQESGRFCVNILAADQEAICRQFASKLPDKFDGLGHRISDRGSPIIENCVAWIDCEIHSVTEAGDHYIVIGLVQDLQIEAGSLPLLFFQGGYGRFSPLSLATPDPLGLLTRQLRDVDTARPQMERLAAEVAARTLATVRAGDEVVIAASAGTASKNSVATLVGQRLPFVPPTTAVFAAWAGDGEIEHWLDESPSLETRQAQRASLDAVRSRGYSLGLLNDAQRLFASALEQRAQVKSHVQQDDLRDLIKQLRYDPPELSPRVYDDVRLISAPVFGPNDDVALALTLLDFPKPHAARGVAELTERVVESARHISEKLRG